ncbi:MAG: TetR/AcrR family transcriptional regulator [Pseudomonadales bacterium]|nr:TetR/AcrR family transcriptional regulator [Pseudomonadales bacterium]MCP5193541.1 TetR/AcrR family transcriptional regulator [Pseudomonadales bacterium]
MKPQKKQVDHRTRVGNERRQKMRMRLVESTLAVFDEKGLEATVIDDVISAAGVARGTFYNYFQTIDELLAALSTELGNDVMRSVERAVEDYPDPALRLASGLRLYLRTVLLYPKVSGFFWKAGLNAIGPSHLAFEYLPRHVQDGISAGVFRVDDVATAIDIIAGITLTTIQAASTREVARDYPEQMVGHILLALGVTRSVVGKLLTRALPEIDLSPDSMLAWLAREA